MSRILGVDYGERRIGIALSDPLGIIAKPLTIIDRKITPDYISAILETAKERDVNKIVVGVPYTLKGENSKQTDVVKIFIAKLFSIGKIQVIPIDERLSSVAAEKSLQLQGVKTGHEKGRVDETAAAIILQEYLDSQS
ncbi:MAG: Holliday junction resolvase RuvX [Candidatus Marinimicrobia bacterium]|nr:Holliday junction resolvase RuvX [Candidatus Neomarinimicrobiota bacterium]